MTALTIWSLIKVIISVHAAGGEKEIGEREIKNQKARERQKERERMKKGGGREIERPTDNIERIFCADIYFFMFELFSINGIVYIQI